jgi:hypothetical protein
MTTIPVDPLPAPSFRRLTCEEIAAAQNRHLADVCSHKVNTLSCRCSGCESDGRFPVFTSAQDAPLLNTAYDAGSGGALASGNDAQWEVGLGTPAGVASVTSWAPAPVVVNPTSAWTTSPFHNAGWISPYTDGKHPAGADNLDVYFRYRFNIASSANPATFAVTMDFFSDNQVAEIWVNGVQQSTQTNGSGVLPQVGNVPGSTGYGASGFGPKSAARITLNNSWRRCENEIIVYVKSSPGFVGFLAQNAVEVKPGEDGCHCECDCKPLQFPDVQPCITVKWGDSKCDCIETDDVEVLCITVCNCYSNVSFEDLTIGQIVVTDANGRPVPTLPDGTPSVQVIPSGPICFDDIGPCVDGRPGCVSRELVLYTRGAVGGNYRLLFRGVCFKICHEYQLDQCFTMTLCQD